MNQKKEQSQDLKKQILDKFANKDILVHNYLIWNSFVKKPKVLKSKNDKAILPKGISIPSRDGLCFFNERIDKFYPIQYTEFLKIINSLKPWEELDGYLFDESMNWIIAHTHDRDILIIGNPG